MSSGELALALATSSPSSRVFDGASVVGFGLAARRGFLVDTYPAVWMVLSSSSPLAIIIIVNIVVVVVVVVAAIAIAIAAVLPRSWHCERELVACALNVDEGPVGSSGLRGGEVHIKVCILGIRWSSYLGPAHLVTAAWFDLLRSSTAVVWHGRSISSSSLASAQEPWTGEFDGRRK
ncbi:hypothetical protein K505DRAFT_337929 [Melanomma pulvis-pyrius CBS 109.77]|uniref:Uncharacterized protein n=1 Tax=Melanomma pulvis-pyrius CBS 109.77 TaxID=1314802 RepID=A0A6A6XC49_9PLEO|nr:hypothetical protein K505DRAFT_337929 [Melanomma pulvis-pyrius CBS 109.77]